MHTQKSEIKCRKCVTSKTLIPVIPKVHAYLHLNVSNAEYADASHLTMKRPHLSSCHPSKYLHFLPSLLHVRNFCHSQTWVCFRLFFWPSLHNLIAYQILQILPLKYYLSIFFSPIAIFLFQLISIFAYWLPLQYLPSFPIISLITSKLYSILHWELCFCHTNNILHWWNIFNASFCS